MYFLALCPRQPGIALDLFLCVALNSPSRNQNYPDSKEENRSRVLPPESQSRTPFPGVQGLCPLGFPPVRTPCSLCPATEPPACSISCFPVAAPAARPPPRIPLPTGQGGGTPVQPRRVTMEMWPCPCRLPGPLQGESESLSLPSLGLPEPSVIPLFIACLSQVPLDTLLGGRDGPQAGRAGSLNCLGKGWDFPG